MWTNRKLWAVSSLVCVLLAGDIAFRITPLSARQNALRDRVLDGRTVTLLPDGRRLLTGGANADEPVSTIVMEDPGSGTSQTLDVRLAHPRSWHSATVLPDGTVLVFGGEAAGRVVTIAERFDPSTETLTSVGSMGLTSRAGHTATLLSDGRVLLIGGTSPDGGIAATETWNVVTGEVERDFGGLSRPRRNHTATLTEDGDVWVSGGVPATGARTADGELFVAGTGRFIAATPPEPAAAPFVSGASPADNTGDVPESILGSVRFSAPVDVRSVSPDSLMLTGPEGPVPLASVVAAEGGRLAFLTPRSNLQPASEYTLTVNGVVGPDGQALPPATFRWWTRDPGNTRAAAATTTESVPRDAAGRPHSPFQDVPPLQAAAGQTALSGQVLRLNGQPLADVKFEIDGRVVYSDARGQFLLRLEHETTQHHELLIDGSTATAGGRTYGLYEVGVTVTGGRTNVLPYTVWMTPLDTAHTVPIPSPTTTEIVVTTPRIPGLEVRIPPGTVIRDHDGAVVRELSITPIPIDQPPFPLPPDLEVPVYFTIQPGGAYVYTSGINVTPGARLIYPNGLGLPNGKRMAFWRYDADGKGWYVYGQGTVTGRQIVPDPGIAIYEFTGAMVAEPPIGPPEGPPEKGEKDGDPVDLSTGLFVYTKTDLAVSDVIPIALTRTYRQKDSRIRAFGVGTSHEYEMFLVGATNPWTYIELILASGTRLRYERISPGSSFTDAVFEHTTTPGRFYKSTIRYALGFGVGWDLSLRDGTVYSFPDSEGASTPRRAAVVRIRDRNGNDIVLTRDTNWNLTQITSKHGRWIRLTYDTLNRITRAEDNIGRDVLYTYDATGRLETVTDVADGVTTYTYDAQHRMRTIRDPRNITYLTNDYDANGRVILQTQADTMTFHFAYTLGPDGKVTQTDVTDPRGFVRRVTFNGYGYPLTDTRALGTPVAQTTTYVRQAATNLPLSVTDALGRKTAFTYDILGNVLTVTRLADTPDAVATTFTYESTFSQLASAADPLNHTTTLSYDPKGHPFSITDANGNATTNGYDALGRRVSTTDGAGNRTQLVYNGADVQAVINPVGDMVTRTHDGVGRVVTATDGRGGTTHYEYNAFSQVTRILDAALNETVLTYDPNGNLLTLTDARTNTTTYTYDNMDRVATRLDPLLRDEMFLYDANGNLREVTDRKNQVTTYTYDPLNRPQTATFDDESTITHVYDAGNRLTQVLDSAAGTITRDYDGLDRLTSETTAEGILSYTYDSADRRATMTVAGQPQVTYGYDSGNRLTSITQNGATVGTAYDVANRRTLLTLPNGVTAESTYDAASA
jgi:YD repeat-containing protein